MPRFLNKRTGYELVKVETQRHWYYFCPTIIYRVSLPSRSDMLTFIDSHGVWWQPGQPDTGYDSDMGSVPWLATCIVAKDEFLLSFFFHDAAWGFKGLWCSKDQGASWAFVPLTRFQANSMLIDWVEVDPDQAHGCGTIRAHLIYSAVQIGAVTIKQPATSRQKLTRQPLTTGWFKKESREQP